MAGQSTSNLHDAATWWIDESGVVHICESAVPLNNELLIWTLCDREVEIGATFAPSRHDTISCSKCAAAEDVLKRRARGAPHPAAFR
jgi:hypothetical protein